MGSNRVPGHKVGEGAIHNATRGCVHILLNIQQTAFAEGFRPFLALYETFSFLIRARLNNVAHCQTVMVLIQT